MNEIYCTRKECQYEEELGEAVDVTHVAQHVDDADGSRKWEEGDNEPVEADACRRSKEGQRHKEQHHHHP